MRSESHTGQATRAFLTVALLIAPGYSLITEDIDVVWTISGDTALTAFGASLASGDVNGDGIPDILVASDSLDWEQSGYRGMVYIYYGSHVGSAVPDVILRSPMLKGSNTPRLACGDLNGDGYADIAMGEDMADDAYGICTIWMGGNPIDTIPHCVIHGRYWWLEAHYGCDVSIGDLNGDGYNDLLVGAYYSAQQPGQFGRGRAYAYYGRPDGVDTIPDVTLLGGHDGEREGFGMGVSAEGDFDHDGFHDLYIGAWVYGSDARGRMYVYYGGNPMDTSYDMAMSGEGAGQKLGFDKPGALTTQSGFDYAVEGCELWSDPGGSQRGKVYIHVGGRPMDSIPDISLIGPQDCDLGVSAQSAGDATGDGNDDLVAGAPSVHPPSTAGAAYLWETGAHFDTVPDAWMFGESEWQLVGFRTSTAGDLDGDGRSEFMVSNYPSDEPTYVWVCKYTGSGVEETPNAGVRTTNRRATVVRYILYLPPASGVGLQTSSVLLDISGRKVLDLQPGTNDVRGLAPGVYFVREEPQAASLQSQAIRKVVVTR